MTHGRRMCIPSPSERVSNHILGALYCFRSSYWPPPKGAASSVPVLISRTSPSTWRPPPPRRPAHFAAMTHAACTAGRGLATIRDKMGHCLHDLFTSLVRLGSPSEECCIRKAVNERGLNSGPVGLADAISEDEAATGTAFALM
jgi:hypothetical protein